MYLSFSNLLPTVLEDHRSIHSESSGLSSCGMRYKGHLDHYSLMGAESKVNNNYDALKKDCQTKKQVNR